METYPNWKAALVEKSGEVIDSNDWDFIMPGVADTDIYGKGRLRALVDHKTRKVIIRYLFTPGR